MLDGISLESVRGGLNWKTVQRAADIAHARYEKAFSNFPRTEADNAELRKIKRFFKTLVDGHLREE